jgi:hypothetical protein
MADELLGSEARIRINEVTFDVKEGSIKETRSTSRGDIFKDGRSQRHHVESQVVNLTFKAIRRFSVNPHTGFYSIAQTAEGGDNDSSPIEVWPDGSDDNLENAWRFRGVWTEYSETFNAEQGLMMIDASCVSLGKYKRPGDEEPEPEEP